VRQGIHSVQQAGQAYAETFRCRSVS